MLVMTWNFSHFLLSFAWRILLSNTQLYGQPILINNPYCKILALHNAI